jgi:hypothetical protein
MIENNRKLKIVKDKKGMTSNYIDRKDLAISK